jgi:hypothetical protein
MHFALKDLPIVFAEAGIFTREMAFGDFDVSYELLPANLDLAPLFKGLPDDLCQCDHWGYLLRGRVRVKYKDRVEVINAGDCFYMPPGHLPFCEEDSEWIIFSPRGAHKVTADVVRQNWAAFGA